MKTCFIEDCDRGHYARGWCRMHYARWGRHGSTDALVIRGNPEADFWSKAERGESIECWPWRGTILPNGYGRLSIQRRSVMAHRFAYELLVGPIPEGLVIDHLCRNRACVNPSHLEPVTCRENILRGEGLAAINARKSRCMRGHDDWWVGSQRSCRRCATEREAAKRVAA